MKATEDFFLVVLHAYIIQAARTVLKNTTNLHTTLSLAKEIVDTFLDVDISERRKPSGDNVHEYTRDLFTLLIIWHYFHDSVREGDGDRVMLIWKLLLLIYHATKRSNYAKEAAILLFQKDSFFSERKVAQLKWSRFVNVHGFAGHNVPTDLHICMEHLNRKLKTML